MERLGEPVVIPTPRWGPMRIQRVPTGWAVSRSNIWRKRVGETCFMRAVVRSSLWVALRDSIG
jgi:hypothetical protein